MVVLGRELRAQRRDRRRGTRPLPSRFPCRRGLPRARAPCPRAPCRARTLLRSRGRWGSTEPGAQDRRGKRLAGSLACLHPARRQLAASRADEARSIPARRLGLGAVASPSELQVFVAAALIRGRSPGRDIFAPALAARSILSPGAAFPVTVLN